MSVAERLVERRAEVLARWRDMILGAGSRAGAPFPVRAADPFHEPVPAAVARATEAILDLLAGTGPLDRASACLEELVRIRAVQDLKASDAVAFMPDLRRVLRDALGGALDRDVTAREALDARIDGLTLQAFDSFLGWRERIYELKAREAIASSYLLLRRARLAEAAPAPAAPVDDGGVEPQPVPGVHPTRREQP